MVSFVSALVGLGCLATSTWGAEFASTPARAPAALIANSSTAVAICPFCAAINATFAEQIGKHEISVIAKLVEIPPEPDELAEEFPKAKFEIVQVIKGEQFVANGMVFQTQLVGKYALNEKFLVMGVEPPSVFWSTPMQASERVIKYLLDGHQLPPSGPQRLAFYQDYFEDAESVIAFDAYDEFAIADYKDLIAMKDQIKRDRLIQWIHDPEIRVDRRRLYFTMLGVCGTAEDIKLLESFLVAEDSQQRAGLDALAAAYLTLKGEAGIPLLEQQFLTNFDESQDTAEINAVISALRFHGTEVDQIPRARIAQAVRRALKHPQLADTVIPDLARWEDWSVMEELVELFKNCSDEYQYVRVPVVAYLHSCPKPEAKQYLKELEKIDPDSIRRARFFMGEVTDDELDDEEEVADENVAGDAQPDGEGKRKDSIESKKSIAPTPNSEPTDPSSPDGSHSTNHIQDSADRLAANAEAGDLLLADQMLHVSTPVRPSDLPDDITNEKNPPAGANHRPGPDDELVELAEQVPVPSSEQQTSTASLPVNTTGNTTARRMAGSSNAIENSPVAAVSPVNLTWLIIFVPLGFSLIIFVLIWSVVNGWFERLIF